MTDVSPLESEGGLAKLVMTHVGGGLQGCF